MVEFFKYSFLTLCEWTNIVTIENFWWVNPLTPISVQDRISPYNINQINDENKEKY